MIIDEKHSFVTSNCGDEIQAVIDTITNIKDEEKAVVIDLEGEITDFFLKRKNALIFNYTFTDSFDNKRFTKMFYDFKDADCLKYSEFITDVYETIIDRKCYPEELFTIQELVGEITKKESELTLLTFYRKAAYEDDPVAARISSAIAPYNIGLYSSFVHCGFFNNNNRNVIIFDLSDIPLRHKKTMLAIYLAYVQLHINDKNTVFFIPCYSDILNTHGVSDMIYELFKADANNQLVGYSDESLDTYFNDKTRPHTRTIATMILREVHTIYPLEMLDIDIDEDEDRMPNSDLFGKISMSGWRGNECFLGDISEDISPTFNPFDDEYDDDEDDDDWDL